MLSAEQRATWEMKLATARVVRDHTTLAVDNHLKEIEALLREVEWSSWDFEAIRAYCPSCSSYIDAGHAPDCRLAAALGSAPVTPSRRAPTDEPGGNMEPTPQSPRVRRPPLPIQSHLPVDCITVQHRDNPDGTPCWRVIAAFADGTPVFGVREFETLDQAVAHVKQMAPLIETLF